MLAPMLSARILARRLQNVFAHKYVIAAFTANRTLRIAAHTFDQNWTHTQTLQFTNAISLDGLDERTHTATE